MARSKYSDLLGVTDPSRAPGRHVVLTARLETSIPTSWTDKWHRKGSEVPGGKGLASAHPTSHSYYPTPTLLRPQEALYANLASGVALTFPYANCTHFSSLIPKMLMFSHFLPDSIQFTLIRGTNIQNSYAILVLIALDLLSSPDASTTEV